MRRIATALALGALLAACGAERPARSPARTPAPPRATRDAERPARTPAPPRAPGGEVEIESWSLVCPEGTRLRGQPPPGGRALWCERPDGTRHGPYLRWRPSGRLAEFGEYAAGEPAWTFPCTRETRPICHHLLD